MRVKTRLLDRLTSRAWIQANALLRPFGRGWWVDAIIVLGLGAALFGLLEVAREWTGIQRPAIEIDLSPWALPGYTFFSMVRGLVAYVISLAFTLVYAYWAAHDRRAERLLVPLLDILQSIPVLGFMPGLVLAMVAVFPRTNVGLELAAIIMIFTGQAWNMTFSLYHSLKSIQTPWKPRALRPNCPRALSPQTAAFPWIKFWSERSSQAEPGPPSSAWWSTRDCWRAD